MLSRLVAARWRFGFAAGGAQQYRLASNGGMYFAQVHAFGGMRWESWANRWDGMCRRGRRIRTRPMEGVDGRQVERQVEQVLGRWNGNSNPDL